MTNTARMYGDSLYDLATEEGLSQEILEQMGQIRALFAQNPDYLRLLAEPQVPLQERLGLIETAFGEQAQRYLINFIKLLCERNLLLEFAGCEEEFTRRYNQDHDIAMAVVTSAVPLTDEQKKGLLEKLQALSGKQVSLTYRLDASIIAGLKVEMEGKCFDGTAQGQISGLSHRLRELTM